MQLETFSFPIISHLVAEDDVLGILMHLQVRRVFLHNRRIATPGAGRSGPATRRRLGAAVGIGAAGVHAFPAGARLERKGVVIVVEQRAGAWAGAWQTDCKRGWSGEGVRRKQFPSFFFTAIGG